MRPSALLIVVLLFLITVSVMLSVWFNQWSVWMTVIWILVCLFVVADYSLTLLRYKFETNIDVPKRVFIGHALKVVVELTSLKGSLPKHIECVLEADPELEARAPLVFSSENGDKREKVKGSLELFPSLRGLYSINQLWIRWSSILKMFDVIAQTKIEREVAVTPDISPVVSGAVHTQLLPLEAGQKDQRHRGHGSEFHQLQEYSAGMDTRSIDWKRSARMHGLVVREMRAERNHQIILCVDSGRLMVERIAGLPKIDHAINAALAMCWASGLAGDLVGLYSFNSRPRIFIPPSNGRNAFSRLQAAASALKYETVETNHTLGLGHLISRLKRRSLIVIFSDFVDSITAELMFENIEVLIRHHVVVYVALRDPALDKFVQPKQVNFDTIAQSVSARQLLKERSLVLERLSRIGVHCLDTSPEDLTTDLISRYIDIKTRELI